MRARSIENARIKHAR